MVNIEILIAIKHAIWKMMEQKLIRDVRMEHIENW